MQNDDERGIETSLAEWKSRENRLKLAFEDAPVSHFKSCRRFVWPLRQGLLGVRDILMVMVAVMLLSNSLPCGLFCFAGGGDARHKVSSVPLSAENVR